MKVIPPTSVKVIAVSSVRDLHINITMYVDILVVTEDGAENITGFPYGPDHNVIG